jgi:NAD(P)-dependent dehydrogenase (short-subunit alcohol dehydrogenase family)
MNVNVRGTIDLIRQVLPHMAKTEPLDADGERGIVIMVASSAAFDGQPGQGKSSPLPSPSKPVPYPSFLYPYHQAKISPKWYDMVERKALTNTIQQKWHTPRPKVPSHPSPSP